jgi:acetylglutamate kinase
VRLLIKLGGTLLDDPDSRARLAREITELGKTASIVVVHGGGKQMTRFLSDRGIESRFVNGLRVTTPEILDAVLKIFGGSVNAGLVSAFRAAGARPVGLTGLDDGLVDAELLNPDLGYVGRPVRSNSALLNLLTREGYLPVVACIAGDAHGQAFNINGDQMAVACAGAFGADKLIFLTDVEGVRDERGETRATLTIAEALDLIRTGIATGGMQAKLEAAMSGLQKGVQEILISPGATPGILKKIATGERAGSRLVS